MSCAFTLYLITLKEGSPLYLVLGWQSPNAGIPLATILMYNNGRVFTQAHEFGTPVLMHVKQALFPSQLHSSPTDTALGPFVLGILNLETRNRFN